MKPFQTVALLATAAAFGMTTWLMIAYPSWSRHTGEGMAWLCMSLTISVALLTLLCLLAGAPPGELPVRFSLLALVVFTGLFVVASTLVTDTRDWFDDPAERATWLPYMAAEWAGFAMVLATVLFLPRAARTAAQSRPVARVADRDARVADED